QTPKNPSIFCPLAEKFLAGNFCEIKKARSAPAAGITLLRVEERDFSPTAKALLTSFYYNKEK
ncbi:MAG: hypothetical protein QME57_04525, partial [Patescibacteria group bacterium]|nr:hypothetical protein [Patescibacteria group bacterium]